MNKDYNDYPPEGTKEKRVSKYEFLSWQFQSKFESDPINWVGLIISTGISIFGLYLLSLT